VLLLKSVISAYYCHLEINVNHLQNLFSEPPENIIMTVNCAPLLKNFILPISAFSSPETFGKGTGLPPLHNFRLTIMHIQWH
jgi:hypothetical protein